MKGYILLPFYVWISELRVRCYFLETCFLSGQFKKSLEGAVLNFHGAAMAHGVFAAVVLVGGGDKRERFNLCFSRVFC